MSRRSMIATIVIPALMASSCTTIGPTVSVEPGAGKSRDDFARDRKECMGQTDQALQPVANRANFQAATTQDVADSNQRIQVAYNQSFGTCMASRGNVVPNSAVPLSPEGTQPPYAADVPRVSDASNTPALSDPDSEAAKQSIAPKVRALLAGCPGETIAVAAHNAPLWLTANARLVALTQPNGGDCLGHIGESDFLVVKQPDGSWRTLLAAEPGSIGIVASSHGGDYRDVELRSFGSCIYSYYWNGRGYYAAAAQDCTLPAPAAPGGYAGAIRDR